MKEIEKRMPYRDYVRHYANCKTVRGSYDTHNNSIIVLVPPAMLQPKRGTLRFDPRYWERRGQEKYLRGHTIYIRQYGQGRNASFVLRAHGSYDEPGRLCGDRLVCNVDRNIPGYGPDARDAAIADALRLAASGLYTSTWRNREPIPLTTQAEAVRRISQYCRELGLDFSALE